MSWRRPPRHHARAIALWIVAVGVLLLAAWLGLYVLPPTLVPEGAADPAKAESDARTALVQTVAGLLLLGGLIFTGLTLRLNREGQITDRFTKAIEQLGAEKLDVRLGGIYALERIARDSANDHWTIMEVLTAFVRAHSIRGASTPDVLRDDAGAGHPRLAADLQAALTVIGRRRRKQDREGEYLDLGSSQLTAAELFGVHLEGANLSRATLDGAFLVDAHLDGAMLQGAHLKRATLEMIRLREALLSGAHLEGADLADAHLEGAILVEAHLEGAVLQGAHLRGADLWRAHLEDAQLRGADLTGANLQDAHLRGATASGATQWPKDFDPAFHGVVLTE